MDAPDQPMSVNKTGGTIRVVRAGGKWPAYE